jgi:hypothetical protein
MALPVAVGDEEERAWWRRCGGTLAHLLSFILVLFIVTGLNTMLCHDSQWNESAMGNSVVVAGAMKSMSMAAMLISTPRMEEHQHMEVNEHRQHWHVEP